MFKLFQKNPTTKHFVGLSLSLCVAQIVEHDWPLDHIRIVAGTCCCDREEYADVLDRYSRTAWRKNPAACTTLAWKLWDEGLIQQPRLDGLEIPPFNPGEAWRKPRLSEVPKLDYVSSDPADKVERLVEWAHSQGLTTYLGSTEVDPEGDPDNGQLSLDDGIVEWEWEQEQVNGAPVITRVWFSPHPYDL